jgi:hypothetical protein
MSAVVDKTYAKEQLEVATAARGRLLARVQAVLGPQKGLEAVNRVTAAAASRLQEDNPELFD